jgi:hypothetical protein
VIALTVLLAALHLREKRKAQLLYAGGKPGSSGVRRTCWRRTAGARVLFVGDPFRPDEYFLLFLTRLV